MRSMARVTRCSTVMETSRRTMAAGRWGTTPAILWTDREMQGQNPVSLLVRASIVNCVWHDRHICSASQGKLWQRWSCNICTNNLAVSSNASEWGQQPSPCPLSEGNVRSVISIKRKSFFWRNCCYSPASHSVIVKQSKWLIYLTWQISANSHIKKGSKMTNICLVSCRHRAKETKHLSSK